MGVIKRYGRHIYRDPRWKLVRTEAKRRDGWKCVQCGSRIRLEVDHVLPVRDRPDLAFEITNLQTLCGSCHGRKTRVEVGLPELSPDRQKWRDFMNNPSNLGVSNA